MRNNKWNKWLLIALVIFVLPGFVNMINGASEDEGEPVEVEVTTGQEQAVRKAESWLDALPFSKSELKDRLILDGFTDEEAEYAVDAVFE